MAKITREDIKTINKHSNWSEKGTAKALRAHVYNGSEAWGRFLRLFLLCLGVAFITFGILFFFAYNWQDLHKFVKMGLIEALVVALTLVAVFSKIKLIVKHILLTATSIMVGVLLAVFGQVYQTGANAYDLFLGWTLLITLWVIVANFAPMWLLYVVLINTTFILYIEQVANDWSGGFIFMLLFALNVFVSLVFVLVPLFKYKIDAPKWLQNLLLLYCVGIATVGCIDGIFDGQESAFGPFYLLVLLGFGAGIWYGLKQQQVSYIAMIPFGAIIIASALLIKISDGAAMFFTVGMFIIISVSLLIMTLIKLQRKWKN